MSSTVYAAVSASHPGATATALTADAVSHGAKLACGGQRIGNRGYFFPPTVLTDVPMGARVMNEEPIGPIAIMSA